jgi:hypothetical protein
MSTDRSPNQEELDALRLKIDKKLDRLRADGSKAAAPKADLIARINTALERRPSVNLNALISEALRWACLAESTGPATSTLRRSQTQWGARKMTRAGHAHCFAAG